jgi:hypothetical protein
MIRFLGKLLFPSQHRDVQRRKISVILAVVFVSVLLGGLLAFFMIYRNKMGVR